MSAMCILYCVQKYLSVNIVCNIASSVLVSLAKNPETHV